MEPGSFRRSTLPGAFVARTLFVLGAAALMLLSAKLASLYILVFGAVIVAVILRSIADPLSRYTPLGDRAGVLSALLLVVLIVAGVSYLFGWRLYQQASQLIDRLPQAWALLQIRISSAPLGAHLLELLRGVGDQVERVFALAPKIALGLVSGLTTLVLVVVAGAYLASDPVGAREGVLSLAPRQNRSRLRHVLNACGSALKGWFRAQLISMALVGLLSGLGLWAIGVPNPMVLGLVTGLAQFVPVIGPIAASLPALLLAATGGTQAFLLTLLLFIVISQLEANFITPLVQKNVASLPVVFGIFAIVGFGDIFGPLGVLFATPLALTLYTLITLLYKQDVLGDELSPPSVSEAVTR